MSTRKGIPSVWAMAGGRGNVGATNHSRRALEVAPHEQIAAILARHLTGDWGDLSDADKKAKQRALKYGARLFSSYEIAPDTKLWV
jgi:hypothetical protein